MDPIGDPANSPSPSFNSYFNTDLAEVVAIVTAELPPLDHDDDFFSDNAIRNEDGGDLEADYDFNDGGFEFNLSDLAAAKGEIRPVYPVFDRDLVRDFDLVCEVQSRRSDREKKPSSVPVQLRTLFLEDRDGEPPSSSSSSEEEDDELEQIPEGTYCVWTPNKSPSQGRCTKSKSTGSSATVTEKVKAWKLSDLLKRSKSDGKDQGRRMMLLTPKKKAEAVKGSSVCSAGGSGRGTAARERNFAAEKNKRRSYLPYRQDLLGFSVSPQVLRKMHLLPF